MENKYRKDFPFFKAIDENSAGENKGLIYFDTAATAQRPFIVLNAMTHFYATENANPLRGLYSLSERATLAYENARETVAKFINAKDASEIVFTRNASESLNLVAYSWGYSHLKTGDEVCVSIMEHHSNIVPWQLQAQRKGIVVKHLPITDDGCLVGCDSIAAYLTERTKLVSVTHVSNVLGTINPVKEIVKMAHERGIPVLIDGAQSTPHMTIDVQDLNCDFFAFSGHKMYGPTGIGVLYGKEEWLEKLPPYQGGGEMIDKVSWERTTFERLPYKFEAGTPDYIATHGLATAIDYLCAVGLDNVEAHETMLTRYCMEQLRTIPDIRFFGEAPQKDAVVSFLVGDIHHLDMGTLLDRLGIAVRTGHHCAQPLMTRLGISGTVRASFAMYNTKEEIDRLVNGIRRVSEMF
jgi:cysteine desulfurase/selenocysteine lyase